MVPTMRVAKDWTMAPRVTPARPLTFWGFSLREAVRPPVLFSSRSKNSTAKRRSAKARRRGRCRRTVLPQDGLEAQAPQTSSEDGGGRGEHVVLEGDSEGGDDSNDEEPKGITVTSTSLVGSEFVRETFNTLGEDKTEGRVHHTTHCNRAVSSWLAVCRDENLTY